MYHYEYVEKNEYKPVKNALITMINEVQKNLEEEFTFNFTFIGSSERNMITRDFKQNIGYDFDVDIEVDDEDENFSPKDLKTKLMNKFNEVAISYLYESCEDNTQVFTIKVIDKKNSKIKHSCDFAIINDCNDGRRQYVRHSKKSNTYSWEFKKKGYYKIDEKIKWCKDNNLWQEVRDLYLDKKNNNTDINKLSSSIFSETLNEVCLSNGYKD